MEFRDQEQVLTSAYFSAGVTCFPKGISYDLN